MHGPGHGITQRSSCESAGTHAGTTSEGPAISGLLALPQCLLHLIFASVPNRDAARAAVTCRGLAAAFRSMPQTDVELDVNMVYDTDFAEASIRLAGTAGALYSGCHH